MSNVFCVKSYEYMNGQAMQQYYYVQGLSFVHSYGISKLQSTVFV